MKPPAIGRRRLLTLGVWLLVFASVVPWRQGVLYAGGADPFVIVKALVAVVGAACALALRRTATARRPVRLGPTGLVLLIVAISLLGALAAGVLPANLVLAMRLALLIGTILLLVRTDETGPMAATMLTAMGLIGVLAAVTGLVVAHHDGRLGGGVPPLEPNGLATLLLPPAIGLVHVLIRRGIRPLPLVGLLAVAGVIVATGSRTSLAMLVLAAVLAAVLAPWLSRGTVVVAIVSAAAAACVLAATDVLGTLLLRDEGVGRLLTLNSRTISWQAALSTPADTWSWWIGNGLSMKSIAVQGQYWATQVFDSSWVSSFVQDGVLGTAVLVLYVVGTLVVVGSDRRIRGWALPIALAIVLQSFLENGLIESSATFTVFFTLATAARARRRTVLPAEPTLGDAADPCETELGYPARWTAADVDA